MAQVAGWKAAPEAPGEKPKTPAPQAVQGWTAAPESPTRPEQIGLPSPAAQAHADSKKTITDAPDLSFNFPSELGFTPPVTGVRIPPPHEALGVVADGLHRDAAREQLAADAAPARPKYPGEGRTLGLDPVSYAKDVAGNAAEFASGATHPKSLALIPAAIAAPEIVLPYMAYTGTKQALESGPAGETGAESARRRLEGGANVLFSLAGARTHAEAKAVSPLRRTVTSAVKTADRTVVQPLRKPAAGPAITQAIQPGANIPRFQESQNIIGPRIQQLKQDGLLTGPDGQPLTEIKNPDDLLQAVKAVKRHVWDHVEDRLGPVDDYTVDGTPIAEAMSSGIPDRVRQQYPQIAEAIERRADTYRRPISLRGLEEAIEDANNELRDYYKRGSPTDSRIGPHTAATESEVSTARQLLDDKVAALRGDGVADLKREYGAARDLERASARAKLVADRQKGVPLYEGLAMLRAAGELVSGNVLGAAKAGMTMAVGRWLKMTRSPEYLIDQAFQGPKQFGRADPIVKLGPHMPTPVAGAPWTGPGMDIAAPPKPAPGPVRGADWTGPGMDLATREPAPPAQGQLSGQQKQLPASHMPPNAAGTADRTSAHTNPAEAAAMAGVDYPKPAKPLRPEDKLLTGPGGTAEGPGSAPPTEVPPKPGKPRAASGARPARPMQGRATPAKTGESPANRPQTSIPAKPMVNGRVTLQGIAGMTDREALEQIITDRTKSTAMREAAGARSKQLWAAEQPKPEAAGAEPPLEKIKGEESVEYLKYIQANGKLSQDIRDAASARITELEQGRKSLAMKREGLTEASSKARELIKAGKGDEAPAAAQPAKPMQRQAPVKERYPADLVSYAEGQMKGALELAQSFERPGRYMDIHAEQGVDQAFNAGRDYTWRGVKSSAHHVAGAFPWYKGEGISLSTLRDAVTKGKGPVYERIMQKVIEDAEPEYRASQAASQKEPIADVSKPAEPAETEKPGDLLYQFNGQGEQKGIHVDMTAHQDGYAVTVIDEDSGQALPHVTIYKDRAQAFEAARKIAHGEAPKAEPAGVLPGMGEHVEKQKAGAAQVQGEQMTEELKKPLGSIEGKAGEMERNSPLFRGTDASPQKEIFGNAPAKTHFTTEQEFAEAAKKGKLRQASGTANDAEKAYATGKGPKSPLGHGTAAGYSPEDIAHFYLQRRGGDVATAFAEYRADVANEAKKPPTLKR